MEDFSCRDQFRELEWGKVAKGWGESQAQLPTLHGPKVLMRNGGERRLLPLPCPGEQTEA